MSVAKNSSLNPEFLVVRIALILRCKLWVMHCWVIVVCSLISTMQKKLVKKNRHGVYKYCYSNRCMLFYKDDENERSCKFCEKESLRQTTKEVGLKTHHKKKILLPTYVEGTKTIFFNGYMQSHEIMRTQGSPMFYLIHPTEKHRYIHFDLIYSNFAQDPQNVRLGLCVLV